MTIAPREPWLMLQPEADDQPPADEQPQADEQLEADEEPEADEQEARFDDADGEDEETETETIKVPNTSVKQTRRGQKGRKETPLRKDTPLRKETAEKKSRESNAKKNKKWGDSEASSGSDTDRQSSSNKKLVKKFIKDMSTALEAEVQSTLSLAPGEELNEESIGFIMQRAQAVIQHQCDTLYDPEKQVHQDICYEIILRARSVTSKFEEDLNWDQFSNRIGDLLDLAADALRVSDIRLLSPDLPESDDGASVSSKSTKRKQKRKAPTDHRRQPAGPDDQAFGAGRGTKSREEAPRPSRPKGRSLGDLSRRVGHPRGHRSCGVPHRTRVYD